MSLQPEKNKIPSSSDLITLDISGDKYCFVEHVCLAFKILDEMNLPVFNF